MYSDPAGAWTPVRELKFGYRVTRLVHVALLRSCHVQSSQKQTRMRVGETERWALQGRHVLWTRASRIADSPAVDAARACVREDWLKIRSRSINTTTISPSALPPSSLSRLWLGPHSPMTSIRRKSKVNSYIFCALERQPWLSLRYCKSYSGHKAIALCDYETVMQSAAIVHLSYTPSGIIISAISYTHASYQIDEKTNCWYDVHYTSFLHHAKNCHWSKLTFRVKEMATLTCDLWQRNFHHHYLGTEQQTCHKKTIPRRFARPKTVTPHPVVTGP